MNLTQILFYCKYFWRFPWRECLTVKYVLKNAKLFYLCLVFLFPAIIILVSLHSKGEYCKIGYFSVNYEFCRNFSELTNDCKLHNYSEYIWNYLKRQKRSYLKRERAIIIAIMRSWWDGGLNIRHLLVVCIRLFNFACRFHYGSKHVG